MVDSQQTKVEDWYWTSLVQVPEEGKEGPRKFYGVMIHRAESHEAARDLSKADLKKMEAGGIMLPNLNGQTSCMREYRPGRLRPEFVGKLIHAKEYERHYERLEADEFARALFENHEEIHAYAEELKRKRDAERWCFIKLTEFMTGETAWCYIFTSPAKAVEKIEELCRANGIERGTVLAEGVPVRAGTEPVEKYQNRLIRGEELKTLLDMGMEKMCLELTGKSYTESGDA